MPLNWRRQWVLDSSCFKLLQVVHSEPAVFDSSIHNKYKQGKRLRLRAPGQNDLFSQRTGENERSHEECSILGMFPNEYPQANCILPVSATCVAVLHSRVPQSANSPGQNFADPV